MEGKIEPEGTAASENDGAFNDVAEFTDVPGRIVGLQLDDASLLEAGFGRGQIPCRQLNKMLREQGNIFAAFAERSDLDGKHIQSISTVFAKAARGDFFFELSRLVAPMIRTISPAGAVFAHPLVYLFLQDTEQLALEGQGNFADFIKEKGSILGGFKTPGAVPDGPGE